MTKRISCKVIRTDSFIERRSKFRNIRSSKNDHRRADDFLPDGISFGGNANPNTYTSRGGALSFSAGCEPTGQIINCFA